MKAYTKLCLELMLYILARERYLWDLNLLKCVCLKISPKRFPHNFPPRTQEPVSPNRVRVFLFPVGPTVGPPLLLPLVPPQLSRRFPGAHRTILRSFFLKEYKYTRNFFYLDWAIQNAPDEAFPSF
jgi:hypothetical protein